MVSARGRNREKDLYVSRGFTSAVPRQHVEVVCATLEYEEFSKGQLLEAAHGRTTGIFLRARCERPFVGCASTVFGARPCWCIIFGACSSLCLSISANYFVS